MNDNTGAAPPPLPSRQNSHFGLCPDCDLPASRILNVERTHWAVCTDCQNRWLVGSNLFSGWRDESEGDWLANEWLLIGCDEVEAGTDPRDVEPGWQA